MSLFDSSNKGAKFAAVGDSITGTITGAPTERQQTDFTTKQPAFWPNGDPKMQILVPLQTSLREDPDDDGVRTLYVASRHMKQAIGQAIRTAGASDVVKGGVLTVRFVGTDPASKNPQNPAKMYDAQYTAPAAGPFAAQAAQQPVAPPAPAPVAQYPAQPPAQPVYAAPAPVAQPVAPAAPPAQQGVAGMTAQQVSQVQQLQAAGIPAETIAAAVGVTVDQINQLPF